MREKESWYLRKRVIKREIEIERGRRRQREEKRRRGESDK